MKQKFVVRLMSQAGEMLAWVTVYAVAKPQRPKAGSCPFYAEQPTLFRIDCTGDAASVTVHWCDLDVVRTVPIAEPVPVVQGQTFAFHWFEPVWLVHGERDIVLPATTVGESVVFDVPVGGIGLRAG